MPSLFSGTTEGVESIPATGTNEMLVQWRAATTKRARLLEWGVSFAGTNYTTDRCVRVELARCTFDTGIFTSGAEVPWDEDNPTALLLALHSNTSVPTQPTPLMSRMVSPRGSYRWRAPRSTTLVKADSSAITNPIGIWLIPSGPNTLDATGYMLWEE